MKKLLILSLTAAILVSISACGLLPARSDFEPASSVPTAVTDTEKYDVYFLNADSDTAEMWSELAEKYEDETGKKIKIETPEGNYDEALAAALDKRNAPTMFSCVDKASAEKWADYCLELDETAIAAELTTNEFNFTNSLGKTIAVGSGFTAYGIAANEALLELAGYSLADVADYASMKAVAEDIHARTEELGFDAFPTLYTTEKDSTLLTERLLNAVLYYQFGGETECAELTEGYLNKLQNIWTLVSQNTYTVLNEDGEPAESVTVDETAAKQQFTEGKAVFFICDAAEFDSLKESGSTLTGEELVMLPIYCGVDSETNAGLCCKGGSCWAFNNESEQEAQQVSIDFLVWVVTSPEGTAALRERFGMTVYKGTAETDNLFYRQAFQYNAEGKYILKYSIDFAARETLASNLFAGLLSFNNEEIDWTQVQNSLISSWTEVQ